MLALKVKKENSVALPKNLKKIILRLNIYKPF